jgi:5-methylcytosine-specific restriction protein A
MSESWSEEELRAAIEVYFEIQEKIRTGQKLVKKHYYRDLSSKFGRTPDSFEFRMQNISYVLTLAGRDWIPGLPPAKHVGTNVVAQIEKLIADIERKEPTSVAASAQRLIEARKSITKKPDGTIKPALVSTTSTTYSRDEYVKAWVLNRANGLCEACEQPAPFVDSSNFPFLEVHHVRHLADGGSDTVTNAVALCPNCHRRLHYSKDSKDYRESLFHKVPELVKE